MKKKTLVKKEIFLLSSRFLFPKFILLMIVEREVVKSKEGSALIASATFFGVALAFFKRFFTILSSFSSTRLRRLLLGGKTKVKNSAFFRSRLTFHLSVSKIKQKRLLQQKLVNWSL